MATPKPLFSLHAWTDVRATRTSATYEEIRSLDADRILNTSIASLCTYYEEKNSIEIPVLLKDAIAIDAREGSKTVSDYGRSITVSSLQIDLHLPYAGPADAFNIQPTMFFTSPPVAFIAHDRLVFTVASDGKDNAQVKEEINRIVDRMEKNLGNLRTNIEQFRRELNSLIKEWLNERHKKVLADKNLVASLGYPLKVSGSAANTYAAPQVRRKIAPTLPPISTTPFKPEPALLSEDYEHILSVLHDMAIVMERSPTAFHGLDEEALQFHFLVQLNGHYEGSASGETFNYQGKTDILIRVDGRNIFIAECKFWSGPAMLTTTIDQLLGYTSWRDTKTSVIIFNRNKDFSKVLAAIPRTVEAHTNYRRSLPASRTTEYRYVFGHRDDPNRELILTILAFDVPRA